MRQPILQRGQGTVEFLLAAPVVLLLGLGSIEAVHWYFVRQAVSQALAQAARAAITQHAHPSVLDTAFSEALLPLYAASSRDASRARLHRAMLRRETATALPAWRIEILSPNAATFADFASNDRDLPASDYPVIDNDYLHEQHQSRLVQGWPQGRGPMSGQTTLEANTLLLHLTWLHEPLLPGVKQLLRQLAPKDTRYGSVAMAGAGYLPMQRQVALMMQSHPIAWKLPTHGRIVRGRELQAQDAGATSPPLAGWAEPTVNPTQGSEDSQAPKPATPGAPTPTPPHATPALPPPNNADPQDRSETAAGENEKRPDTGPDFEPDDCPGCCN